MSYVALDMYDKKYLGMIILAILINNFWSDGNLVGSNFGHHVNGRELSW